jgi:hypothetical protein
MKSRMISIDEQEIRGKWILRGGKVQPDEECRRIHDLVASYLQELGCDSSGWDRLYLDPEDGRYWELAYPESELHGGGPPLLRCISIEEARTKFGDILG